MNNTPAPAGQPQGGTDLFLLVAAALLVMVGTLMIYSSSTLLSDREYGDSFYLLRLHLGHIGVGLLLMFLMMRLPYTLWRDKLPLLLLLSLVLLLLVLIPGIGHKVGGARRWLGLGPFNFQPVELLKLVLIAYVASYLDRKRGLMENFLRGLAPNFVVMGVFLVLLLLQPDFGSVVLITFTLLLMVFVGGAKPSHIFSSLLAMGVVGGWLVASRSYRMARILAFMDPWGNRHDAGFQVVQSFLAFGNGGLLGMGVGASRQKMFFLPDAHTDFIMAIVAEELGLVGVLMVMGLLGFFLLRGFRTSLHCPDDFGKHFAFGLTVSLALQMFINLGVVTGTLPTKGLPMPFISYGGSSLVACLMMTGILLGIGRQSAWPRPIPPKETS